MVTLSSSFEAMQNRIGVVSTARCSGSAPPLLPWRPKQLCCVHCASRRNARGSSFKGENNETKASSCGIALQVANEMQSQQTALQKEAEGGSGSHSGIRQRLDMSASSVLICGGGVFGLSTALELAKSEKYKAGPSRIVVLGQSCPRKMSNLC